MEEQHTSVNPLALILLVILGGGIGAGIIFYGATTTVESQQLINTPLFWVWLLLISGLTAYVFVSVLFLWPLLRQLRPYGAGHWHEVGLTLLAVGVLVVMQSLLGVGLGAYMPLAYYHPKIWLITGLALVVALLALAGIVLAYRAARTAFLPGSPDQDQIRLFLFLQSALRRFLTVAGGVIGLAVMATGALRNTLISVDALTKEAFPPEMVLAYGAYFTIILALVYLPTYNALRSVGLQICEALFPFPVLEAEAFGKWYSARKNFEGFLQLEVTAWQNAQTSLAIFAPLLGSAITLLVGK